MSDTKKMLFVDLENIGKISRLKLSGFFKIFVFVGRHQQIDIADPRIVEIKIDSVGRNNLDMHLAFYLGEAHAIYGSDIEFVVASNDNDFVGLVRHIARVRNRGCVVKKVRTNNKTAPAKPKSVSPVEVHIKTLMKKVVDVIRKIKASQLPRKVSRFTRFVASILGLDAANSLCQTVIKLLRKRNLIQQSGGVVTYHPALTKE